MADAVIDENLCSRRVDEAMSIMANYYYILVNTGDTFDERLCG